MVAEGPEADAARREVLASTRWLMNRVLDGVEYPAQRWQLLAQADINGVDGVTLERLRRLPVRSYRHSGEVASMILDDGSPDESTTRNDGWPRSDAPFTPVMETTRSVARHLVGVAHQR